MVQSEKRRPTLAIVMTIVWGVLLLPGALLAITSPFMFDSGENPFVWSLFWAALAFPILCVASIVGSWVAWRILKASPVGRKQYLSIAIAYMPLVPAVYLIAAMIVHPSFQ
jgi:hypothetical protein